MGFNAKGRWRKGGVNPWRRTALGMGMRAGNAAATFWVWGCGMIGLAGGSDSVVECLPSKQVVAGSNPVSRSNPNGPDKAGGVSHWRRPDAPAGAHNGPNKAGGVSYWRRPDVPAGVHMALA